jgi:UDP-hydrolysing UDP-N-acetyl-D-glucosamine 2-epimerase
VTYHPVTLEEDTTESQMSILLDALRDFSSVYWVFTHPNADTGGRVVIQMINDFNRENPEKGKIYTSLGQLNYLSLLKHAMVMVGNSSSGLTEAPSFELPVVNIGDRQKGRIRAANVIDVPVWEKNKIISAIERAISKDFRDSLKGLKNPYGDGNASARIVKVLKTVSLKNIIKKEFHELKILRKG